MRGVDLPGSLASSGASGDASVSPLVNVLPHWRRPIYGEMLILNPDVEEMLVLAVLHVQVWHSN